MTGFSSWLIGLLAQGLCVAALPSLPYLPTIALPSQSLSQTVYLFQPSGTTATMMAMNISGTLRSPAPMMTITAPLPFLTSGDAFTPMMDEQGIIYTFSGRCDDDAEESMLWTFRPNQGTAMGSWSKNTLAVASTARTSTAGAPSFLSSGMAFSGSTNEPAALYVFGGMCPESPAATPDWQSSATYSNQLISMRLSSQGSPSSQSYDLDLLSSRGPPIPEAGFSVTPLQITSSQSAYGTNAQQQNFVLLGGQTSSAFINMSQVALFSLPEENWTFLPVKDPSDVKTDLAVRASAVDPRSGHTAIVSEDGQQIIVFGGWVGDITTPAEPQLAILQLGSGYGGTGDWQWIIPNSRGEPAPGSGIYGHGSVLLPGGVMMIVGGFHTAASGTARKRDMSNDGTYFFNTSSNSWQSSYTNPFSSPFTTPETSAAASEDQLRKVGLGTGLGLGMLAILVAIAVYVFYRRRSHLKNKYHEKDGGVDSRGAETSDISWMRERSTMGSNVYPCAPSITSDGRGTRGTEAERTGLLVEIPSPTRGLRRSLHSRNIPPPPSRLDDGHRSRTSNIHPIDERAEYEGAMSGGPDMGPLCRTPNPLDSAPVLDPFVDPDAQSRSPSPPSPAQARDMEVQNWVSDWASASEAMRSGRVSPEKPSERTLSTLSEQSILSSISGFSIPHSIGFLSRSISQRSAALFTAVSPRRAATSTSPTRGHATTTEPAPALSSFRRSLSLSGRRSDEPRLNTAESFATAPTSFSQLQAEGEAFLGRPETARHDVRTADATSPQEAPQPQGRTRGWMGSVRRVLLGERNPGTAVTDTGHGLETPNHNTQSSPTRRADPRRLSTAGAPVWQTRRGRRAWDVEGAEGSEGRESDEEDWDVESAVERRVVQVMFTVPRGELRIINGGGEVESLVEAERGDPSDEQRSDERATEEKE